MNNRDQSRRNFLKTSAAGVVGTSFVSATAFSNSTAASRRAGKPALLGGEKVYKGAWPTWPQGNRTAEDAIQGLGGYGYINEYEVEKIKRDVKITTIYEGTSEIQQSIISTFRWKKTLKSKGKYYGDMSEEMEALAKSHPDLGADLYAKAAKNVNEMTMFAHSRKLTNLANISSIEKLR